MKRRKMKMLVSILMSLMVVSLALAGCKSGEEEKKPNDQQNEDISGNDEDIADNSDSDKQKEPDIGSDSEDTQSEGAEGDMLKLELQVAANASGAITYYTEAFVVGKEFVLESGDMLCYDMTMLNEVGGLGAVDMYVGEEPGDATLRDDTLCTDQNFLRDHPTVNLAGLAYNMWYAREIYITDSFVDAAAGKDAKVLIAVEIPDASTVAGQTLTVLYDNIRIVRNGETVYTIFADQSNTLPETPVYYLGLTGNENVVTTLSIQAAE